MIVTHVVLRPFDFSGRTLAVGSKVNASQWRNTESLIAARFLRPANDADRAATKKKPSPVPAAPVRRVLKIKKVR